MTRIIKKPFNRISGGDMRKIEKFFDGAKPADYYVDMLNTCYETLPHDCGSTACPLRMQPAYYHIQDDDLPSWKSRLRKHDMLWKYRAFWGKRSADAQALLRTESSLTKSEQYKAAYDELHNLMKPLAKYTIFCEPPLELIAHIFDEFRALQGGTVETTKMMHAENPELVMIVDRAQIYDRWWIDFGVTPDIDRLSGTEYVNKLWLPAHEATLFLLEKTKSLRLGKGVVKRINKASDIMAAIPLPRHKDYVNRPKCRYTGAKIWDDILRS